MGSKVHLRGTPVKHDAIHDAYIRILRGIHYRHEFARRNAAVAEASKQTLDGLGVPQGDAASFFTNDGSELVDVIARAYRRAQRAGKGSGGAKALQVFLSDFRVLPLHADGPPFLPTELTTVDSKTLKTSRQLDEDLHARAKKAWNSLLAFEAWAMAEFKLGSPVFMPALPLQNAKTRTRTVNLVELVDVGQRSCPVCVDLQQPMDVIGGYLTAIAEQLREGELVTSGRRPSRQRVYVEKRLRFDRFDFFLTAYDLSRQEARGDDISRMKWEMFLRSPLSKKPAEVKHPERRAPRFYRDCLKQAKALVERYCDIV
ncbi:hypothetical protein ACFLSJ_06695 [Verrucomicrobiota bacterium]